MKRFEVRTGFGILLLAVGILFLLQNLGVIEAGLDFLWALLFGAGGAAFVYVFLVNRDNWWAIIPGFTLLALGLTIAWEQLFPGSDAGGALFLAGIGLSFFVIYYLKREFWWAIIPGGVMATLAFIAGFSSILGDLEAGGVLFLGIGLTFGLVAYLPGPKGQMKWALIPAGVLLAIGVLMTLATTSAILYVGPVALVLVGAYIIYRAVSSR